MTIEELSKLSDEELRVMCAEAAGWTPNGAGYWHRGNKSASLHGEVFDGCGGIGSDTPALPCYTTDLNAMADAEAQILLGERRDYENAVARVAEKGRMAERGWLTLTASARQRCIAFISVKQPS
jgi:hypothetical protein